MSFTEPYYDAGTVYMTMALAFYDRSRGSQRGVISVDMVLPQLQKLIETVNNNSRDLVFAVGKSGQLLAHPKVEELLARKRLLHTETKIDSILDLKGDAALNLIDNPIVHESFMEENGWKIVVASPRTVILASYLKVRTFILAAVICYLSALLIVFYLVRYYNEKVRRVREQAFNAIAREKEQFAAVVNNVQFGLMRVNEAGEILPGYSKSSYGLLGFEEDTISGKRVWDVFCSSVRESENFETLFEQVFELPELASDLIQQLPSQFMVKGKILDFRAFPILKNGKVDSILLSFSDVTQSRQTEVENEVRKSLIRVIQNKDRFQRLLADIYNFDLAMREQDEKPDSIRDLKRHIHTWKGDLGTFRLAEIALFLHEVEEKFEVKTTAKQWHEIVHLLRSRLDEYLKQHYDVLHLSPSNVHETLLEIKRSSLTDLQKRMGAANSLSDAILTVKEFVEAQTMERASDILRYLSIATLETARKLNKKVKVETSGEDLLLPSRFEHVIANLIHVVRNAVDHSIEHSSERGSKGPEGRVSIELSCDDQHYHILIADDGQGINFPKLKQTLVKRGLVTEDEWDRLSTDEQIRFIFARNVSTKDTVTEVSGRGVGLDALLASVDELNGTIDVGSNWGYGACFSIRLPKNEAVLKVVSGL